MLGERVDLALLLVRIGRAVESLSGESFFKEPEECVWPLKPSLVDLKSHPSGQVRRHRALPSNRKIRGIKRGSAILLTDDVLISPESPFFACVYLIAEQIPSRSLLRKEQLP